MRTSGIQYDSRLEPSKVNSSFDLAEFEVFDATNVGASESHTINVLKRGAITLSAAIGSGIELGTRLEVLVNKKGNIIVIRKAINGIACRPNGSRTKSKFLACKAILKHFEKNDIELPVKFRAEYDENMQAWVGRRC